MMNQLQEFILHHWELWLALLAVLSLMLINEHVTKKNGPQALSTTAMIDAINHQDAVVIDIREAAAYQTGHVVGSKNLPGEPLGKLEQYKQKPLILICSRGLQSSALAVKLRKQGFTNVMILAGGITAWKSASLPLTQGRK
ncbi:MAG: rhodanese-like domain-containing protein [Legionella sp.]|jgi:rhodanese-related sulfurtransferase|nr:rhodanese-like domain-containing protein [Legionella sp.]